MAKPHRAMLSIFAGLTFSVQPADSFAHRSDHALVERVMAAITTDHLTKVDRDCLALIVEAEDSVDVREHHGDGCPGDPETEPHLFQVKIDRHTGRLWSDAGSADGRFKRLKE